MGKHNKTRMTDKESLLCKAKLAESCERYEDMVETVIELANKELISSVEERNILSVAFKNVVGARRAAFRVLYSIEDKERKKGEKANAELAHGYKEEITKELNDYCNRILGLLDTKLIETAVDDEAKVF